MINLKLRAAAIDVYYDALLEQCATMQQAAEIERQRTDAHLDLMREITAALAS
jgi:hypothetical protein